MKQNNIKLENVCFCILTIIKINEIVKQFFTKPNITFSAYKDCFFKAHHPLVHKYISNILKGMDKIFLYRKNKMNYSNFYDF